MKVFNSTLAAIGLAAFVFASCSDSNSDPAGGTAPVINPADLTSVKLVAQQIDNSNIANYKNSTANARKFFLTRAGATNFTTAMPTAPTKESFSKVLNLSGPADLTKQAYTISSGKDINFTGKKINGATIFVDGKCTMQYDETTQMSNTTIVLLSSATLKYNGTGDMIPSGCTVYCTNPRNVFSAKNDIKINGNFYADFRDKKSDGSKDLITGLGAIKETTPAEKDKSITPTQNITFGSGANVFIDGSIRAINLQVEDGANVYAKKNLFNNDNNGNATINGNLWIGGFIKTRTLDVNGYLKAEEALKVTNAFNVHNGANVEASYINVTNNTKDGDKVIAKGEATLSLNGTGKITIHNQNVITANNLVTDNASAGQITLAGENAVAVIKAHKFTNNGKSKIVAFATPGTNSTFLLQFQENYSGSTQYNTFEDLDIAATYADYDKVADKTTPNVTLIDKAHKKYGYQWSGDPATIASQAKLDLIASEESKGGQSATCIQSANNKLYVSYHTYGDKNFGGNIEVLSMTGNQLQVDANKAAENCDYNHLIVDGNSLYLAGSGTKSAGAFLGKVDLNGGNLGDEVKLYAIDNKTKMDANSVAAFDGEHIVATTKGLTSFDNEFSHWNKTGDEGKSVVVANSKLYTLDVKGNVNVYDNKNLENPIKTYNVGEVTPTNNKAVLAVDESNGTIYVCKGENGVAKISSTGDVKTDFFTCPTFTKPKKTELTGTVKGRANGIAVGGEYIYVACGGYGLVVLDKEGHVVCHRKANAYNTKDNSGSANYVAVDIVNGEEYAFVAYGQNRVQVFKVTKTK
ncbi:hypothetical protein [Segatella sp.]|uniref:hypothetical protein n=1 Tax=Segatella sp. TaxID=2974253 RepID=UPI00307AC1B8